MPRLCAASWGLQMIYRDWISGMRAFRRALLCAVWIAGAGLAALAGAAPPIIISAAGGYTGDGGQATAASLSIPNGAAVDAAGNLYVADTNNHRIRKVAADGTISTVAGTGEQGFAGDRGPATSAELNYPEGVVIDAQGDLYIADTDNNRVRKVDTAGTISTIAGTGASGYNGDNIPATNALLAYPTAVAVDTGGNVYISEHAGNRIRKVDSAGIITTFAGTGHSGYNGDNILATTAQVNYPWGLALDTNGNLYIADYENLRIRKVDTTGIITTIAGNGTQGDAPEGIPATSGALNYPTGVAVNADTSEIYIADTNNSKIRRVETATGLMYGVAGTGGSGFSGDGGDALSALLDSPHAVIAGINGDLYIVDTNNNRIRKTGFSGMIDTFAGNGTFGGDGGDAIHSELGSPVGVSFLSGDTYVADGGNYRVRRISRNGLIDTVAGNGLLGHSGDGGPATAASFFGMFAVTAEPSGEIFVSTYGWIRRVDASGMISTIAGTGGHGYNGDNIPGASAELAFPHGLRVDANGNLYVADTDNNRVRKVDGSTGFITTIAGNGVAGYSGDGGPATSAELDAPYDVALDGSGNIYVADSYNGVRKIDTNGTISTFVQVGNHISFPEGLAFDHEGNLMIADACGVVKATIGGDVSTVAGSGYSLCGFSGDGGPATQAGIETVSSVAVDPGGNVFIADHFNHRIREVEVDQIFKNGYD